MLWGMVLEVVFGRGLGDDLVWRVYVGLLRVRRLDKTDGFVVRRDE